jgi:hypothetical protein
VDVPGTPSSGSGGAFELVRALSVLLLIVLVARTDDAVTEALFGIVEAVIPGSSAKEGVGVLIIVVEDDVVGTGDVTEEGMEAVEDSICDVLCKVRSVDNGEELVGAEEDSGEGEDNDVEESKDDDSTDVSLYDRAIRGKLVQLDTALSIADETYSGEPRRRMGPHVTVRANAASSTRSPRSIAAEITYPDD